MKYVKLVLAAVILLNINVYTQHEHKASAGQKDTMKMMHEMRNSTLMTLPMSTEGSGTSWLPESTPMYMAMYDAGKWMLMLHGDAKIRFAKHTGLRGSERLGSPNWIMGSAQRMLGMNYQLMFRTMLSLDRLTEGGAGYPLLFQTGESWKGEPLIDRQHPHDLVGELAAAFSTMFSENTGAFIYVGYPGEPALGPPVYLHRSSAMPNPDAPIGHHWQDATHITFGVATLGFSYRKFKIEGSVFTGREPNENRFNFDKPKFDSYSGRLSYNPSESVALQVSSAMLVNPEGDGEDVTRSTASLLHTYLLNSDSYWSSAIIWGLNDEAHSAQHSILFESVYNFIKNAVYGRIEYVQKPQKELGIMEDPEHLEEVMVYSLGYKRKIFSAIGIDFNVGLQGSLYSQSDLLKKYYGDPYSIQFYFGINPSLMSEMKM